MIQSNSMRQRRYIDTVIVNPCHVRNTDFLPTHAEIFFYKSKIISLKSFPVLYSLGLKFQDIGK